MAERVSRTLSQQEISEYLSEPHVCHLATVRPDGRPHLTPIWYLEEDGKAFVFAEADSVKFRNVRQNPKVSLSIAIDHHPFQYVLLEGEGRLTVDNMDQVIERICVRYDGPERGGAYARDLLAEGKQLVLEIQVHRVLSLRRDEDWV